ncbi:hypothetical protein [Spiroplasma endosymbiont of Amphibalanus improvisus]|uniref:ribosome maturation factor RimM n=1 Tax=Spiroplasma endosymbiont of Amphibalanus improvisus TaxID=3066327 RepID=UPI00313CE8F2
MDKLISIGTVKGTHGLKGILKFNVSLVFNLESIINQIGFFKVDEHFFDVKILDLKLNKKCYLLVLDVPYNHIDQVEKFVNQKLYINKSIINVDYNLEDNNYIDYEVILNDKIIGSICEIIDTKSSSVIRIQLTNNKQVLLPVVKEYVKEIDNSNKQFIINRLTGG